MKKKLLFAALASIVLVGCTSNDFVGDTPPAPNGSTAIAFGGGAGKITRATSNTGSVVEMLDNQFKIYGVKNVSGYTDVFQDYILWYNNSTTTSNPDADWEYVGDATQEYGTNNEPIGSAQTIKYWDYSADNYHFVAGSPVANFTYNITNGDIASATVTGLAGHILPNTSGTAISDFNPVYIADPVNVPKANYKQEVTFNFRRQQTRVRVGIFETIPGYSITDIKFYQMSDANGSFSDSPRTDQYIVLNSPTAKYFVGSADATATVTYDWTTPTYTFAYTTGLTESRNFFAGKMTGVPATTSTESTIANLYGTDGDMETASGYFTVMPTPSGTDAAAILIKCDYTLTADDGKGETIKITGATAAIPAAFCKWLPNVSYTYLFKISDNTNGSTGTPGTDPEGLFPITFDAVVLAEAEGTEQGTITTVSTPSITTYQEGSVTETGIKYAVGKPIYFTVQDDESGTLYPLTALDNAAPADGMVQVYVASENNTEADLVLTRPVAANSFSTTIGADAWTINGNTIAANNWASFTPTVARTYAIEYVTVTNDGPVYTYKVVKVE